MDPIRPIGPRERSVGPVERAERRTVKREDHERQERERREREGRERAAAAAEQQPPPEEGEGGQIDIRV